MDLTPRRFASPRPLRGRGYAKRDAGGLRFAATLRCEDGEAEFG